VASECGRRLRGQGVNNDSGSARPPASGPAGKGAAAMALEKWADLLAWRDLDRRRTKGQTPAALSGASAASVPSRGATLTAACEWWWWPASGLRATGTE